MSMLKIERKNKGMTKEEEEKAYIKDFIDMISPSVIKFYPSYYVLGNTYRRVFAVRNYPLECENMALLRKFGEKSNITVKVYCNKMSVNEYEHCVENSVNRDISNTSEHQFIKKAKAHQNLEITKKLVQFLNANQNEKMFRVSVFIEVIGNSVEEMIKISNDVIIKLDGITYDNLFLRQKKALFL